MGYTWINKGSASGVYFEYGNNIYEYDAINNELNVIQAESKTTRTQDLLFVFRNLEKAHIENNELKVYVNHYALK